MLSAVLINNKEIALQEIAIPTPGPGEVVVAMKSALTSSIDVREYRQGTVFPTPLGHEFSGVIYSIGEGVTNFAVGDAVMLASSSGCSECNFCLRQQENYCADFEKNSVVGALSEYVLVGAQVVAHKMFHKPDDLRFYDASFLDTLSHVIHGLNSVPIEPEDTVVIVGCGSIGLLFLQSLRVVGRPRTIIAADIDAQRVAKAKALGADYGVNISEQSLINAVNEITGNYGAQVVIECAGTDEAWKQMFDLASRGSHVLAFGGCPGGIDVTVNTGKIHYDQVTIVGSVNYTDSDVELAKAMLVNKRVCPSAILNDSLPLTEISRVFAKLDAGEAFKIDLFPPVAAKTGNSVATAEIASLKAPQAVLAGSMAI